MIGYTGLLPLLAEAGHRPWIGKMRAGFLGAAF